MAILPLSRRRPSSSHALSRPLFCVGDPHSFNFSSFACDLPSRQTCALIANVVGSTQLNQEYQTAFLNFGSSLERAIFALPCQLYTTNKSCLMWPSIRKRKNSASITRNQVQKQGMTEREDDRAPRKDGNGNLRKMTRRRTRRTMAMIRAQL